MAKNIKIFITERTANQVKTLEKSEISASLQKHIAEVCKFVNSSYDKNKVLYSNRFMEKFIDFEELDIEKHSLDSDVAWRPKKEGIPKLQTFEHSVRDATYDNLVDYLNLNNAMNHWWNDNIPDVADMLTVELKDGKPKETRIKEDLTKERKKEIKIKDHPKNIEESIQKNMSGMLSMIISEKIDSAIVEEYDNTSEKKKK